jgi:hypothetical protein
MNSGIVMQVSVTGSCISMMTAGSSLSTLLVWANLIFTVEKWQNLQIVFILMVLFVITVRFPGIKIIPTTETEIKTDIKKLARL